MEADLDGGEGEAKAAGNLGVGELIFQRVAEPKETGNL
jgi:hypothetical protein